MRPSRRPPDTDQFEYERLARAKGVHAVAGIDEVGRGPLAGPVVAGAVVLPDLQVPAGVTDSKRLTPRQRQALAAELAQVPNIQIGIGLCSVEEIEELNILRATHLAMRRAVEDLPRAPDYALVDGLPVPGLPVPSLAIVSGDRLSASIAAASIVAKVYRDQLMITLDAEYPGYGFARHKGYGTPEHLEQLRRLGPCPAHRRTFLPVATWLAHTAAVQLEFAFPQPPGRPRRQSRTRAPMGETGSGLGPKENRHAPGV